MITLEGFRSHLLEMDDAAVMEAAYRSPAVHFASCVEIPNKAGDLVRPIPNILQLRMSEAYETCVEMGRPCYLVVCKPRQTGCSTFSAHMLYHHSMGKAVRGITVSDKSDNSKKLMNKVRDFTRRDLFPWDVRLNETKSHQLGWTNGSEWEVDSAQNPRAGIGDTRQGFHASEIGKWPKAGVVNDKEVMAAVLPSIHKGPGTLVLAEGTPDGAVGWQYDTWTSKGGSVTLEEYVEMDVGPNAVVWIRIFAAWWEFAEHRREVSDREREVILSSLTDREVHVMQTHGVVVEQIAWWRDILHLECGGDEDLREEYYPTDDVQCWLSSGRPRFNMTSLMAMDRECGRHGSRSGYLQMQDDLGAIPSWYEDPSGDIQLWEMPREGMRYLVGCDPMTGADQTGGKNPDRNSIQVWRSGYYDVEADIEEPPMLVARVRSPNIAEGSIVVRHLVTMSRMYGGCLVVPEVNMGLHLLEDLKREGIPIYKRRVPSARLGTLVEQYGFKLTDRDQRRMVIEVLATAIREQGIRVFSKDFISECKTFVTNATGKDEARAGAKDDDVMCGAMCLYALPSASTYTGRVRRRRRRPRDARDWRRWRGD